MIHYYYTDEDGQTSSIEAPVSGCWISLNAPSEEELRRVGDQYNIDADDLRAALDVDERSRIESDPAYTMVLVNIPTIEEEEKRELYNTIPLAVFVTKEVTISVCREYTPVLRPFAEGRVREFRTSMKSRFVLQILYQNASLYLTYLRSIDRRSEQVESELHRSTQNRELIELLRLEKSLVYFTTALRSNETVMEKLFRNDLIKKYPEDAELLEDVIVENKQAIEMANIYTGILSGTMDAFASVISNNLNIVMKVLAIITVVMAIPTIVFSAYGMNVATAGMPMADSPWGFLVIILVSVALSVVVSLVFVKLKMFK